MLKRISLVTLVALAKVNSNLSVVTVKFKDAAAAKSYDYLSIEPVEAGKFLLVPTPGSSTPTATIVVRSRLVNTTNLEEVSGMVLAVGEVDVQDHLDRINNIKKAEADLEHSVNTRRIKDLNKEAKAYFGSESYEDFLNTLKG